MQPSVAECRQTAEQLSTLCGSPSDISVQKYMTDLDGALNDIEEGLDERELELNRMLNKAQQCTTCLDVRCFLLLCLGIVNIKVTFCCYLLIYITIK